MSQELTQNAAPSGGSTTKGTTGGTCVKPGLYKANDGKIEFLTHYAAGDRFFAFPGGQAKTACTWTLLSVEADGSRTSYTAVKVAAGTV